MQIFCHRGKWGCTDIRTEYLRLPYVKGESLSNFPPENSKPSIQAALDEGYNVEIDVTMTKDRQIIVTHTNYLPLHASDAQEGDFVSNLNLGDVKKLKTGMAGYQTEFFTYNEFIELFSNYDNLIANIEIKGTIMPQCSLPEAQNPSLVEQLVSNTPAYLLNRIVWSSFALSNLLQLRSLLPNSNIAQLFAEPQSSQNIIYPDRQDVYMLFNQANLKLVLESLPSINAVHPCIDSLTDETVVFCAENNIRIRVWSLWERNPLKSEYANKMVINALRYKKTYPELKLDFITDFANEIKYIIGDECK